MKKNRDYFIEKSRKLYGDKFDYSNVVYKTNNAKVCLICKEKDENGIEHGEFWVSPNNHYHGNGGCKKCKSKLISSLHNTGKDEFIRRAKEIHGDKYDYSKVEYIDSKTKVCIICPEHGEFWQIPNGHLRGCGCEKCAGVKQSTTEEFIEKAKKIHGDKYDYSKVEYVNTHTKVCIICPEHGEFWQTPHNHLRGQGCDKCARILNHLKLYASDEEYIEKAKEVHGDKYDYSLIKKEKYITIICPKHGEFTQSRQDHLRGFGCPKCGNVLSKGEDEIFNFLKEKNILVKQKDRRTISPNEIDIFLPKLKIGIEFDGLYWHNEIYKKEDYHLNKTNQCKEKGIRLIHIFEDEWKEKKEIVKSMINNILNDTERHIFARKCIIKNVPFKIAKEFFDKNHLQGSCKASINYGLFYNNELVSIMSFGKTRQQKKYNVDYDNTWELYRFCNKLNTSVVGGASKLLKHFIKENHPHKIITYADKRWSIGNLYNTLGFKYMHDSKPNYFYVIGDTRKKRFGFRKSELVKDGFDPNKSESEIMKERKIYRIYDCGAMVFEMTF